MTKDRQNPPSPDLQRPQPEMSQSLASLQRLKPGDTMAGRYVLLKCLGQGGFGEVWLAETPEGQKVALKILKASRRRDTRLISAFEQEIHAQARITHPGIVALVDEGRDETTSLRFCALDYLTGGPLDLEGWPLREALRIFDGLLEALSHIHARGIVHRDLKPFNVYLAERDGTLWSHLLDFGIAYIDEALAATLNIRRVNLGKPGVPLGSAYYMSPEQARGNAHGVGPASDLYAIGIMLYECLSGERPFTGSRINVIYAHMALLPPPLQLPPGLEQLEAFLMSLLNKDYCARPESAADARHALEAVIAGLPDEALCLPIEAARPAPNQLTIPIAFANTLVEAPSHTSQHHLTLPITIEQPAAHLTLEYTAPPTDIEIGWPDPPDPSLPWHIRRLRELPPIGRESHCKHLLDLAVEVVSRKEMRGVLLTGPSGVGRGRLSRWLAQKVLEVGMMRVLQVDLNARDTLDAALRVAFMKHLRWPMQERSAMEARLDEVFGLTDPAEREAQLAFLLGVGTGTRPTLSPRASHAVWNRMLALMSEHPTHRSVLIWIVGSGPGLLSASEWVTSLLKSQPLSGLVLWAVNALGDDLEPRRPIQALMKRAETQTLHLEMLTPGQQRDLINILEPRLTPSALAFLEQHCQGNPHFIRETLFAWHESGQLTETDKGFALVEGASQAGFSIEMAERFRLEALLSSAGEPARLSHALKLMAMLGQVFSRRQAQWSLEGTGWTPERMQSHRLLIMKRVARQAHYSFADQTLRALLLKGTLDAGEEASVSAVCVELRLRGSLDAMIASDWEGAYQELQQARTLVHTFASRQERDLQLLIYDATARVAYRQRDVRELKEDLQLLSDWAARQRGSLGDRALATARLWEGALALLQQNHDHARQCFEALGLHAELPLISAQALHYLGELALTHGQRKRALTILETARDALKAASAACSSDYQRRLMRLTTADALRNLAEYHSLKARRGDTEATEVEGQLLREALEIYSAEEDLQGESRTYVQLTRMYRQALELQVERGEPLDSHLVATAQSCLERLEALTLPLDDPKGRALNDWEAAGLAMAKGDLEDAELLYLRAASHFSNCGDRLGTALSLFNLGDLCFKARSWHKALAYFTRFRNAMRAQGVTYNEAQALIHMGWTAQRIALIKESRVWFEEASALLPDSGDDKAPPTDLATVRVGLAVCDASTSAWTLTLSRLQQALDFTEDKPLDDALAQHGLSDIKALTLTSTHLLAREVRRLAQRLIVSP